jgi:hypothetical protein
MDIDIKEMDLHSAAQELKNLTSEPLVIDPHQPTMLPPGKYTRIVTVGSRKFLVTFTLNLRPKFEPPYAVWLLTTSPAEDNDKIPLEDVKVPQLLTTFFDFNKNIMEDKSVKSINPNQRAFIQIHSVTREQYLSQNN